MKRQRSPSLVPTGTARQTIAAAPAYPKELLDLVHENDLDEGSAYLAWQLAQFAPEVSPSEREAFMVLVGRLLAAQALVLRRAPVQPHRSQPAVPLRLTRCNPPLPTTDRQTSGAALS